MISPRLALALALACAACSQQTAQPEASAASSSAFRLAPLATPTQALEITAPSGFFAGTSGQSVDLLPSAVFGNVLTVSGEVGVPSGAVSVSVQISNLSTASATIAASGAITTACDAAVLGSGITTCFKFTASVPVATFGALSMNQDIHYTATPKSAFGAAVGVANAGDFYVSIGNFPPAPRSLTATQNGTGQIGLTWAAGSNGNAISGYTVQRAASADGPWTAIGTTSGTVSTYTDPNLTGGSTYYYVVFATNTAGRSSNSPVAMGTTAQPSIATLTPTFTSTTNITIAWKAPTGVSPSTYKVLRSQVAGGPFEQVAYVYPPNASYSDSAIVPGNPYDYVVQWVNSSGVTSGSSVELDWASLPGQPATLTAAASGPDIQLNWTLPSSQTAITSYNIFRATTPGGEQQIDTISAPASSYLDHPGAGTSYYYQIQAVDIAGVSALSAEVAVVAVPSPVTDLTANGTTLSWTATQGASGYNLYRAAVSGGPYSLIQTAVKGTSTTDTSAFAGQRFYYVVKAENSGGEAAASNEVSITYAPATPLGLTATLSGATNVALGWTSSPGAVSYMVFRTSGGGTVSLGSLNTNAYLDTTTVAGGTYSYFVSATNAGGTSANSTTASITLAPPAPKNLVASIASGTSVSITWTASFGATSYTVARSSVHGAFYATVGTSPSASFIDTTTQAGGSYFYVVTATNAGGNSAASNEASIVIAPASPQLTASVSGTTATLVWTSPAGATSYTVSRGLTTGGPYSTNLANTSASTQADASLDVGMAYFYVVTAANAGGSSLRSNEAAVVTRLVAPASVQVAQGGAGSLTVSWSASRNATAYDVQVSTDGFNFTDLGTTGGLSSTSTGLKNGVVYWYRVKALNSVTDSAWAAAVSGTVILPTPGNITVTDGGVGKLNVSWTGVVNADSYIVLRSDDGGVTYAPIAVVVDPTWSYSDSGLANGKTYFYKVEATRANGTVVSAPSAPASFTTELPAPTNLVASINLFDVSLSWSATTNAQSYDVLRSTSASAGFAVIASAVPTNSYCDCGSDGTPRLAGITYYYEVRANTSSGQSAMSNIVSVTTAFSAPSGLTLTVLGRTGIQLTWNADNGATLYSVERSTNASGPFTEVVETSATSWADSNLAFATTYYYRVLALSSAGPSDPSAVASATTLGSPWTPGTGMFGGEITSVIFDPSNAQVAWAGARGGAAAYRSTDGGNTWTASGTGLPQGGALSLAFSGTTLYAGAAGGVWQWASSRWRAAGAGLPATDSFTSLAASGGVIYAASPGRLFASFDGAFTWQLSGLNVTASITGLAVSPIDGLTIYVATDGAGVFKSSDGGVTFVTASTGLADLGLQGGLVVDSSNPQRIFAAAPSGLYVSTDGAQTWAAASFLSAPRGLATSGGKLYAGTSASGMFTSVDAGAHWARFSAPSAGINAMAVSGTNVIAASYNGAGLFSSSNGGASWSIANAGIGAADATAFAIAPSNASVIYAVAGDALYSSANHGASWAAAGSGLGYPVLAKSIAVDPSNASLLYLGAGGVLRSADSGATFTSTGANFTPMSLALSAAAPTTLYAAVYNGGIYKGTNVKTAPVWALSSVGINDLHLRAVAADPTSALNVYAGGDGGFYRSTDSGAHWARTGLTFVRSIAVNPAAPTHVYALIGGTAASMLQRSTDGGQTWTAVNFGTTLSQNLVSIAVAAGSGGADLIWAAGSSDNGSAGGLFTSANSGASWQQLSLGLSSTRLRSVFADPSSASGVFVSTEDSGVLFSSTAGQ